MTKRAILATITLVAPLFVLFACGTDTPQPKLAPLPSVISCDETYEANAVPIPDAAAYEPRSTEVAQLLGGFALDAGPMFSDPLVRRRAAVVCACRAKRNRSRSDTASAWSDALIVLGAAGTAGGSALNGVAATDVDDKTRKTLLTSGIITTAVGALAFGANAALSLNKRSQAYKSTAEDQEVAVSILLTDNLDETAWGRAWSACAVAEGQDKISRLDDAVAAYKDAAAAASSNPAAQDGGGSDGSSVSATLGGAKSTGPDSGK